MVTNGNSAYWNEAKAGWNAAMKWLGGKGATGSFQEPTASEASVQVSLLETLSAQGYSGWGVSAVTAQSLTTPIAQAVSRACRSSRTTRHCPAPTPSSTSAPPTPPMAAAAGKAMTQAITGSGDVVAISYGLVDRGQHPAAGGGFEQCADPASRSSRRSTTTRTC